MSLAQWERGQLQCGDVHQGLCAAGGTNRADGETRMDLIKRQLSKNK